jgi:predicted dehydrogenase
VTLGITTFGIVGAGWRAEFFLRVAAAMPERFQVGGMMVRDEAKGRTIETRWGVPTFRTLDELLDRTDLHFVVVSVPRAVSPDFIRSLADRGMPVLTETPPAKDVDGLNELYRYISERGAKVQVAEQYAFQPLHAARIAICRSGRLGQVDQAQVSAAHGYHGISLIRKLLGIGFDDVEITAIRHSSQIVAGPNRHGDPQEEKRAANRQDIAWLQFADGKLGVFDFTSDQYFSWIRSQRVLIRGEQGEINNTQISYLRDYATPIYSEIRRVNAGENGNLEGLFLKGMIAGEEWVYRNPFIPARLTDDEIAVAECLARMADYVNGGRECYSLAEASQDHYLSLLLEQAIKSGETVVSSRQLWACD